MTRTVLSVYLRRVRRKHAADNGQPGPRHDGPADRPEPRHQPPTGVAFLLAQLGAHGAARFAERLMVLGLSPPHAGILRLVAAEPGLNQRELAVRLRAVPSRVVALVDDLEERGLLTRQRRADDRRSSVLELTQPGRSALASLREIADAHEAEITAALTPGERLQIARLLRRLADANQLTPGVHPGYRSPPASHRGSAPADLP